MQTKIMMTTTIIIIWKKKKKKKKKQVRSYLFILLLAVATATLELTAANFDDEVFNSGKGAFVKFLAPW